MFRSSLRVLSKVVKPHATEAHGAPTTFAEPAAAGVAVKGATSVTTGASSTVATSAAYAQVATQGAGGSPFNPAVRETKLKNGLSVITRESLDNVDYLGFYLRGGLANITPDERGYPQLLAMMLQHTNKISSTPAIIKCFAANQATGGASVVNRQLLGVSAEGLPEDLDYLLETFTNMLFLPAFQHWELKQSIAWYKNYFRPLVLKEEPNLHIEDLIHQAAFGSNGGLGEPLLIPESVLEAGVDMGRLVNLWQRTVHVDNMALVGTTTWQHEAVIEKVQHNEDLLRNESKGGQLVEAACEFVSGTVVDFKSRAKYAAQHGNIAAFGGLAFDAAPATDARGAAAARVLLQHPKLRELSASAYAKTAVAKYHGYSKAGILSFVTSGHPSALRDTNLKIQAVLADVSAGAEVDVELMKLGADIAASSTRQSLVEGMALRWAHGVDADATALVTAADVQAAAKRALAKAPAVVYHGDSINVSRSTLL